MDYRLLPENWVIEVSYDMWDMPEKPARFAVTLRNTRTTESVFAYGDTEQGAYQYALEAAKEMRTA